VAGWAALRQDSGIEGQCFRAVAVAAARYEALLGDRSAQVRACAAVPLALVDPARCVDALVARLAKERANEVALSWLVGLAVATRLSGERPALGADVVDGSSLPALQAGLAIVRAHAGMAVAEAALAAALIDPLAQQETPWGRLGDVAIGAVLTRGAQAGGLLADALERVDSGRQALLAQALVRAVLPDADMAKPWASLRSARAFAPEALEVLRLVATVAPAPMWGPLALLPSVGITRSLPDLRRFLKVDPPGPLECAIPWRGDEVEAVLVVEALALGEADEEAVRGALLAGFPPRERVALALAMADHAYELHFRGPEWTPERAVSFAISLLDDGACLAALESCAADFGAIRGYGRMVLVVATHRLRRRAGEPFLPSLAEILLDRDRILWVRGKEVDYVREVLADAPPETRDRFALQVPLPDRVDRVPKIMGRVVERAYAGWNVLDLAADRPAAARRGVEHVATWTELPEADFEVRPVEAAQRALRALLPEAASAYGSLAADVAPLGRQVLDEALDES